MKIQDIQYVLAVAEYKSFSKAAEALYIAQPSLSKAVKRVEQEYGIELFRRSKGSSLELTAEGKLFLDMAGDVDAAHRRFESQLKRLKARSVNHITVGIPLQQAYAVSGPMLKSIYERCGNQYYVELQTPYTRTIQKMLLDGSLDIGFIGVLERQEELYYEVLRHSDLYIYLRRGSPVAEKAFRVEGLDYPALHLADLAEEPLVVNGVGSSSRTWMETAFRLAGVEHTGEVIESANWDHRRFMPESGQATFFTPMDMENQDFDRSLIYRVAPEENITRDNCLVCRKGFEKDPRFKAVLYAAKESIKDMKF